MSSEIDICNLSLSHLGDKATVASIDPPEGSAQAEHCARFYPIARDALLEEGSWAFNTKRIALASLADVPDAWSFAYAMPSDAMNIIALLPDGAGDDYDYGTDLVAWVCETTEDGDKVIYSNTESAVARYKAFVDDTTKFSPLFVMTLSWRLAGLLAGPVLKGDSGRSEAARCEQIAAAYLAKAGTTNAKQTKHNPTHTPTFVAAR